MPALENGQVSLGDGKASKRRRMNPEKRRAVKAQTPSPSSTSSSSSSSSNSPADTGGAVPIQGFTLPQKSKDMLKTLEGVPQARVGDESYYDP